MSAARTSRDMATTLLASVVALGIGVGSSIALARILGPEAKGIFALAALLPGMIVTFGNLGIGPGTAYHTAQGSFPLRRILGTNLLLGVCIGILGTAIGVLVVILFGHQAFPGVHQGLLFLALLLLLPELLFGYLRYILLGAQRFREFNLANVFHAVILLGLLLVFLLALRAGIVGAIISVVLAWLAVDVLLLFWVRRAAGGIDLQLDRQYCSRVLVYGLQAHVANVLGFLNYRVDVLLVNGFLDPTAVGHYSVAVAVAEMLWLVSSSASTVLFPKVAAETADERRKVLTPFVTRTVLVATAIGAVALYLVGHWLIQCLYSTAYLPAAEPLLALLPGIVTMAVWRTLANDLAGRGRPLINSYITAISVTANVLFNVLLIPRYGVAGAAWASTISYSLSLAIILPIYCRMSGNPWVAVLVPRLADFRLYRDATLDIWRRWVRPR